MTAHKLRPSQPLHSKSPCGGMPSRFRSTVPSEQFPAEKDRYVLYVNAVCPWAHRAVIVRALKGLEDIIDVIEIDARDPIHGWFFSGRRGPKCDPVHGFRWLKEFYLIADPTYTGRITIPVLWDKQQGTIVNNESADIIRMLISGFDNLLPPENREVNKGSAALVPEHLSADIDELNSWVFDTVNNGVYKIGFATSQTAYDEHITKLFHSLDRLEEHLSEPGHHPYLFGQHITEADIRLYTTLIRFDIAYYALFKCNIKMIRLDYPRLHAWLRCLYWNDGPETAGGAFKNSTHFDIIKRGYASVTVGNGIVPAGPLPHIMPL
ncbi:transferase [Boeremia exigua]|uniref:transferase n=1 Tax=Boeremia exigua TaxID=749465 RepID=UPI001E8EAE66|nr:transferase [Boeremia exigua]KAH6622159.1 transferase [Boeremia exigua]